MQNKKVTMLAAVLAVTVIAMAGVGYAVTYHATTTNSGNGMDTTHIVLTQGGAGDYTNNWLTNLYFDSETTKAVGATQPTITFEPVWTHKAAAAGGTYTVGEGKDTALISKALELTIADQNSPNGKVDLKVTPDDTFDPTGNGLKYTMVLAEVYTDDKTQFTAYAAVDFGVTETGKWVFKDIDITKNDEKTYTVLLFASASGAGTIDGETGFSATTGDGSLSNTFEFKIFAESSNTP